MTNIRLIQGGNIVNEVKDISNENAKAFPVLLSFTQDGILSLSLFGGEVLNADLSDLFPTRLEIANLTLPGLATLLRAGIVQLADDGSPDDLTSERKVLPAAGVLRVIQKALDDAPIDLNGTLLQGREGAGQIILVEGETDDEGTIGLPGLTLKIENDSNQLVTKAEFRVNPDGSASFTNGTREVINYDASAIRFNAEFAYFSAFVRANKLGLVNPDTILTPDSIAAFLYNNSTGSSHLGKIGKADLLKWLDIETTAFGDLDATKQKIINALAFTGTPEIGYGKDPTTGKIIEYSNSQMIANIISNVLALVGTGGGGGQSTQYVTLFAGCRSELKEPQMDDIVMFNNIAIGNALTHNLQTTGPNIAIDGVYIFSPVDNYWLRQEEAYSRFLEFPDSETIRFRSDAPSALATANIRVAIKRMIPLP